MSYQKHQVSEAEERFRCNPSRKFEPRIRWVEENEAKRKKRFTKHRNHPVRRHPAESNLIRQKLKEIEFLRKRIYQLEDAITLHEKRFSDDSVTNKKSNCCHLFNGSKRQSEIIHEIRKSPSRTTIDESQDMVPKIPSDKILIDSLAQKLESQANDIKEIKDGLQKCLLLLKDSNALEPKHPEFANKNAIAAPVFMDEYFKCTNYEKLFLKPLSSTQFQKMLCECKSMPQFDQSEEKINTRKVKTEKAKCKSKCSKNKKVKSKKSESSKEESSTDVTEAKSVVRVDSVKQKEAPIKNINLKTRKKKAYYCSCTGWQEEEEMCAAE
ncbi:PREDICTED: uncharacterized protein LOC108565208 isoform X2 [Nicrophorus vespilloides]|uniref:Uncharacterized protein LOC108565208 isoform X2 n=1 Tax=Nicrophorus vespilloides TaxID=110193 RepID=A0ABM1MZL6_NICVS|nr:PREDICTED: uncharacterized protein LOC108565208 isoform X2 [Nicrophorus vespilloides]